MSRDADPSPALYRDVAATLDAMTSLARQVIAQVPMVDEDGVPLPDDTCEVLSRWVVRAEGHVETLRGWASGGQDQRMTA